MLKFIFKDTKANAELVLPVTPPEYTVSHGIKIETVNIHTLGDVVITGYGALATVKVECMFPAREYPFAATKLTEPYNLVKRFAGWVDGKVLLRFIVSDTGVNIPVLVQEISYGERDGSGDVYAVLTLREYRELSAVEISKSVKTGNNTRLVEAAPPPSMDAYEVVWGDTLSEISRRFYGDASLYPYLANYNGIADPDVIHPGDIIKLPELSVLKAMIPAYGSGGTAASQPQGSRGPSGRYTPTLQTQ